MISETTPKLVIGLGLPWPSAISMATVTTTSWLGLPMKTLAMIATLG